MGKFEIVERKPDRYVARAVGNIDPIWLGSMIDTGATPLAPPSNTIAMTFQMPENENV